MSATPIVISGLGSVSVYGPRCGPVSGAAPGLQPITRWATDGVRRACLVPPFKPADAVPGLKTRRMDRLSAWSLVAAGLALRDAGFEPGAAPAGRVGVTFGTALGCLELTEAFMQSIAEHGDGLADPILFPETLGNIPASHVARHYGFKGPNITLSRGMLSGEAALLDAVGQLEAGEASVVVTMAGDVITRGLYAWYETADRLSGECYEEPPGDRTARGLLVPGEGVGAVVCETLEHARSRGVRPRAVLLGARVEGGGPRHAARDEGWDDVMSRGIAASGVTDAVRFVVSGPGVGVVPSGGGDGIDSIVPHLKTGTFGGGALLGLSIALGSEPAASGLGLALGASGSCERAVIVLRVEASRG